jgi:ADP-heptose:LPS heptosyltransferase
VRRLRRERFDAAFLLHPTFRLALALFLSGIRMRVGTGYRMYSFLFNRKVWEHRKVSRRHEAEYNLTLAGVAGAETRRVEFRLAVPEAAARAVRSYLAGIGIGSRRPLVVLHPGTRGSALDWPPSRFAELADRLAETGIRAVFTGTENERAAVDRIIRRCASKPVSAAGRFNLKELCALLERADLFVSNSTGPLHLARALGTEVVGFYPPLTPAHARRWGPYGRMDSVLVPDRPECRTCRRRRCPEWNCMDRIPVDEAWAMVSGKLGGMGFPLKRRHSGGRGKETENRISNSGVRPPKQSPPVHRRGMRRTTRRMTE